MTATVLSLALALMSQSRKSGKASWEVIASKDGNFTVAMPVKPNLNSSRTLSDAGGDIKLYLIGCETSSALYFAYSYQFPTAFVRGGEVKFLNVYRDDIAKKYHGKVVSEKQVRLDSSVGRDYTIQGMEPDVGVLTIRLRQYVQGKSIYALFVVSAPGRELPDDVSRYFGSFSFGTDKEARARAAAPPVNLAGKALAGWGTIVDPYDDSTFKLEGTALHVTLPGTHKSMEGKGDSIGGPRALRDGEVEGDFTVTVKVVGDFKPDGNSTNPKSVPYNGAGLLLWVDSGNYLRLERATIKRGSKLNTYANVEEYEGGGRAGAYSGALGTGTAYLRLERRRGRILPSVSNDNTTWTAIRPVDVSWPSKVKVGLIAVNSNNAPLVVAFEDFKVNGK